MFEAAELGRKVTKEEWQAAEPELRTQLLEIQRALRGTDVPVIVIVSGVEGAGKSQVVNRLTTWLDTRGLSAVAFWDETDEERERPRYFRFWRQLPPRGTIGILFGSWYTRPVIDRALGHTDEAAYEKELARIASFERMLVDDGALIVKFWFHLSKEAQLKAVKKSAKASEKDKGKKGKKKEKDKDKGNLKSRKSKRPVSPLVAEFSRSYDSFSTVSERAIRVTDTGVAPWYVIESHDWRYRDLTVGKTLLEALRNRLRERPALPPLEPAGHDPKLPEAAGAQVTILDQVDLVTRLTPEEYDEAIKNYQARLSELAWQAHERRIPTAMLFEGWDAAGKGGAIRRVVGCMDARLYQVIPIAAPTDEERARHYLWRFWRHVPRAGYVRIYDRSWYGRVLVERVEGFARQEEWMRAYREINDFEEQLIEHGIVLTKFWLHISKEEQLRRFKEREQTPWKQHKITDEDWRNREKWDAYKDAINDMVARTSTSFAPWTIVPGDDKGVARVTILRTLCEQLERALER